MRPNCQQTHILQFLLSWSFAPFVLAVSSQPSAINFLINIESLVLRAKQEFNRFVGKDRELFWSTGVLEFWQKRKPEFNLNWSFHYSITTPLHQTASRGKEYGSPLRGQSEAGSFGSGFFTFPSFLASSFALCFPLFRAQVCVWRIPFSNCSGISYRWSLSR